METVLRQLTKIIAAERYRDLVDRDLLARFVAERDQTAFTVLLERHGPMVNRVCRLHAGDANNVDDLFQATWLVLIRKASSIRKPESLASWLHGTALRIARNARVANCKRRHYEKRSKPSDKGNHPDDVSWRELQAVLDEEIQRLSENSREPVLLCCLEGKTCDEAARHLGWSLATLKRHLSTGRDVLRRRLARRGFALSAALATATLSLTSARAAVPALLEITTTKAALSCLAGTSAATLPPTVAALVAQTLHAMTISKIKGASLVIALVAMIALGTGWIVGGGRGPLGKDSATAREPLDGDRNEAEVAQPANAIAALQEDLDDHQLPPGALARIGSLRLRHGAGIQKVAFSPNGQQVASLGGRWLRLWDSKTGKLLKHLEGMDRTYRVCAFSPDGKYLAAGESGWAVHLWNAETGRLLHVLKTFRFGSQGALLDNSVAFSHDSQTLFTGGRAGVVQAWDVKSGAEIATWQLVPPDPGGESQTPRVTSMAMSPDGTTLAVALTRGTIKLWNVKEGKEAGELATQSSWIREVKFAPEGKVLAWCGTSARDDMPSEGIVLWDLAQNRKRLQLPGHDNGRTYAIAFSKNGNLIASTGLGNRIKIWDTSSGKELHSLPVSMATNWSVAFSPDGSTLVSGGSDGALRLWDVATGAAALIGTDRNSDRVVGLSISGDGKTLFLGSQDGQVRKANLANNRIEQTIALTTDKVEGVAFSANQRFAAIARGRAVELWNLQTEKQVWSKSTWNTEAKHFDLTTAHTESIQFSPDGRLILTKSTNAADPDRQLTVIRIWNATTGALLSQFNRPFTVTGQPVLSPDGSMLILSEFRIADNGITSESALRSFDTATGRNLAQWDRPAGTWALSPDGQRLVSGSSRNRLLVHEASSGELQFVLQGRRSGANLSGVTFSADGKRLATTSHSQAIIQVWDLDKGTQTHEFPRSANALTFTPDGARLLTGHGDGTTLVWDVNAPAPPPRAKLSQLDLERRWLELAYGYDSLEGNRGLHKRIDALVEGGDQTVAFLEKELLDPKLFERDRQAIDKWLTGLSSPNAETREAAVRAIAKFGDLAFRCVDKLDRPATAALQRDIESVLLKNFRFRAEIAACEVLSQIGNQGARDLLVRLERDLPNDPEHHNRKLMAAKELKNFERLKLGD